MPTARSASNANQPRTIPPRTSPPRPQQGRRVSDSERSAELIRKHDEPTPFFLPKVLTRVSARSESAGERRPLRLERQTASNRSASTLKSLEPFRLEPQNDLEPSCLELLRLAPQQGRRVSDSERSAELIRKHDEPTPFLLPKMLTRVSARSESADERRPLRLEQSSVSNHPASNAPPQTSNDLEPFHLELFRLELQTAANSPPSFFRTVSTPDTPYPAAPALSPRRG